MVQVRVSDAPVRLTEKASQLAAKGHPWFYRDDLQDSVESRHGSLVRVASDQGHNLGLAFCSARSRLALRRCGAWDSDLVPSLEEFFGARLTTAWAQRAQFTEEPRGVRLVNGDADWLPGLVVDQYGSCLVVQSSTATVEQSLSHIVPWLKERTSAESILARNDIAVRRREGLPEEVRLLDGRRMETSEIQENGIRVTGFIIRCVQSHLKDRILKLLSRSDYIQPIIEHLKISSVTQYLIDINGKFKPISGTKIGQSQHEFLTTIFDRGSCIDLLSILSEHTHDLKIVSTTFTPVTRFNVIDGVTNAQTVTILVGVDTNFSQFCIRNTPGKRKDESVAVRVTPDVLIRFQIIGFQIDDPHMNRIGSQQPPRLQMLGAA